MQVKLSTLIIALVIAAVACTVVGVKVGVHLSEVTELRKELARLQDELDDCSKVQDAWQRPGRPIGDPIGAPKK